MTNQELLQTMEAQREFFRTGTTLDPAFRVSVLKKFKQAIKDHADELCAALHADLGKSSSEAYLSEVGMALEELSCVIKNTKKWSKAKRVGSPLAQFPAKSFRRAVPFGNVLVMSPWNYPVLLSLTPLIDAVAAGNTVILKPSQTTKHTSQALQKLISSVFDQNYVACLPLTHQQTSFLLDQKFDYIFFTGNTEIGKQVLQSAAQHLTPVTLELGGKSPCIVDKTANIPLAAKRIVFGKFLNCGQTCVAPDFVYCDAGIKDQLVQELKKQIVLQYGENSLETSYFGKIITKRHFDRLLSLTTDVTVAHGGQSDPTAHRIVPTVLTDVTFQSAVMQEEIFGPLLPILTYENIEDAFTQLQSQPSPLAFYIFSKNKANIEKFVKALPFGGGCINDTIIHLASTKLAFGGVGNSGMGQYHGKHGFDTFSHTKNMVDKKLWLDLPFRYAPYTKSKDNLIKKFLK